MVINTNYILNVKILNETSTRDLENKLNDLLIRDRDNKIKDIQYSYGIANGVNHFTAMIFYKK